MDGLSVCCINRDIRGASLNRGLNIYEIISQLEIVNNYRWLLVRY